MHQSSLCRKSDMNASQSRILIDICTSIFCHIVCSHGLVAVLPLSIQDPLMKTIHSLTLQPCVRCARNWTTSEVSEVTCSSSTWVGCHISSVRVLFPSHAINILFFRVHLTSTYTQIAVMCETLRLPSLSSTFVTLEEQLKILPGLWCKL